MNFERIREEIDRMIADGLPEAQVIIRKDGKEVFRYIAGYSDEAKTKPARYDDIFWLYSMSKVYTMTAALRLVERGVLDIDEPIGTYLPAFKKLTVVDGDGVTELKSPLTLRRLMSMTGGFNYDTARYTEVQKLRENKKASTMELVNAFSRTPLLFQPGERFMYGYGHDIVAGVIEAASGMSFGEFIKKELLDPIGITDMGFHMSDEQLSRLADKWKAEYDESGRINYTIGQKSVNWLKLSEVYESGGAGLFGNAEQYIKLADALANGGVAENGYRVLKKESIDLMRTNQLGDAALAEFHEEHPRRRAGYGYGLGVRTVMDTASAGICPSAKEFGWDGAAGSYVLIDPENHISVVYAEHIMNHTSIYEKWHPMLRDLTYECLKL